MNSNFIKNLTPAGSQEKWCGDYNQALKLLKQGISAEEILARFPNEQAELAPLLKISSQLLTLPKNIVPTPMMQRRYALAPSPRFWLGWMHLLKVAATSVSVMLLVSALGAGIYATTQSVPGTALFSVKKTAENLELVLATTQQNKATLQIAIAQQRLSEAQQIFADPKSNSSSKTSALNELANQTASAVASVKDVASADPASSQTTPLVASLVNLTNQQKTLLKDIPSNSEVQSAAQSALATLNQTDSQVQQIKMTVAAANSDQTLTSLSSNPNAVAVLGVVNKITADQITVEKTAFSVNDQTQIKDTSGKTLSLADLATGQKVEAIGTNLNSTVTATEIVAIDTNLAQITAPTSTPASAATPTATGTVEAASTVAGSSTSTDQKTVSIPSDSSSPTTDPNTVIGSFIPGDPAPQFAP